MRQAVLVLAVLLPLFLMGVLAFAGDEDPAKPEVPDEVLKPFLWVIPGEVPQYLFGTMHTVDERVTTMHPAARKAYEESEAVYLEVDILRDAPKQLEAMKLPAGKTTAEMIPADLLKRLDARLAKIHPMLARGQIGELKTMAWVLLVPTLHEQMKKPGVPVLDAKLYTEALQAGKTVGGLEKPEEQTAFLDSVTNDEALLMLRMLLDDWEEYEAEGQDPSNEMVGFYLRGDGKALHDFAMDMMAGEKVPKELSERLLKGLAYDRNERIAKAIAGHLKENPKKRHFFAVGAMHLLGKQSVQEYLQKLGVETRRVDVEAQKPEPAGAR